ncbi:xylose isomerase [Aestuariivirga litoralis]|uniref:xylose isomerase n=1 Tax=Aestuariivirga litoralis TaxID=2650924 RepID=UPI0018C69757|nr:xylose isomerase [Aestuariivirga litoralis]MBG1232850.1 xylose isomerase [Aestuariivirga litoralis]
MNFYLHKDAVKYEGPNSQNALAFKWYNPSQQVMGKSMRDHLRFAVCYWHTLCWPGGDPFGGETFNREWHHMADPMKAAEVKAELMFETLRLLDIDYFTFHDLDIAPEGKNLQEFNANVSAIAKILEKQMAKHNKKLLWGTANMFSNRRFMAGAATNPDPDVFAYCAAQVKHALDVTHGLGGENYVMWGGREGYETLINTRIGHELHQAGRFLSLVVDYKHKIGFKGPILIEPKPKEPSTHQYDYDVASIWGMLKSYGLEKDVKMNIEQNHAILAGHTFEHEIALASSLGIFGSLDLNRGGYQVGWDTDQFAMNVPELTLMMLEVIRAGGFTTGGMNFDAKIRRQSIDPDDLLHAHVASMDACARGLLNAAKIIADGKLDAEIAKRYSGWDKPENKAMLDKGASLDAIAARVHKDKIEPQPRSARQEYLEGLLNNV